MQRKRFCAIIGSMAHEILLFAVKVIESWATTLTGTAAGVAGLMLGRFPKVKAKVPRWGVPGVVAFCLLVGCFRAWQEVYHETQTQRDTIKNLTGASGDLRGDIKGLQGEIRGQRGEIRYLREARDAKQDEIIRLRLDEPAEGGGLRWFPKSVAPTLPGARSAVRLIIQADRAMPNARIEIEYTAPFLESPDIGGGAEPQNIELRDTEPVGGRRIRFTVVSPELSEGQTYKVVAESAQREPPIQVVALRRLK